MLPYCMLDRDKSAINLVLKTKIFFHFIILKIGIEMRQKRTHVKPEKNETECMVLLELVPGCTKIP